MTKHLLSVLLVMACPLVARAQSWPQVLVPRTAAPPGMKAAPDETAWNRAALIPRLTLSRGADAKGLSPLPTSVRLLWDAHYLYLRFRCADAEIYTPIKGRDAELYKGDVVEVFLDPVGDARWYIELEVSPRGDIFDQMFSVTAQPRFNAHGRLVDDVLARDWWPNLSWTLDGLRVATRVIPAQGQTKEWIADIAIPAAPLLRRLGKSQFEPMDLRAHFLRYDWTAPLSTTHQRRLVAMNWATVDYGCPHISPAAMGFVTLNR